MQQCCQACRAISNRTIEDDGRIDTNVLQAITRVLCMSRQIGAGQMGNGVFIDRAHIQQDGLDGI
jgi:hypothetical protein